MTEAVADTSPARSKWTRPTWAASGPTCRTRSAASWPTKARAAVPWAKPPSSAPRTVPTKRVAAQVVESTDKPTLQGFVVEHAAPDATVYTDEASAYEGLPMAHEAVKHSVKEYVRGQVHTNGMESFWSMLKRGYVGIYHKMSPKHLDRYVQEFAGRHNLREADTLTQMGLVVRGFEGKRLTYTALKQDNGMNSGARGA